MINSPHKCGQAGQTWIGIDPPLPSIAASYQQNGGIKPNEEISVADPDPLQMFNNEVFTVHQKSSQTKLSRISANLQDICKLFRRSRTSSSGFNKDQYWIHFSAFRIRRRSGSICFGPLESGSFHQKEQNLR
jgi:hypothetical protein